MKDKNGNSPLIDDGTGRLIDNPEYKSDDQLRYEDKKAAEKAEFDEAFKDVGANMKKWANENSAPKTKEERENFAKTFKPKTSKMEISLSGKDKTTIKFTSAFNSEYTVEQFENLGYFSELRFMDFKKVLFSNGKKVVASRDL